MALLDQCACGGTLDGEFVCKVEVDRGAWGEYDDNPINVMDWQQIMVEVRKFAGRAFVLHVEIKLNHQLEMTPWTREEEENNGNGTLNDIHINSSGVIGDMSNVFSSKAYETICNSLSVVNHTNIQSVIARFGFKMFSGSFFYTGKHHRQ